MEIETVFIGRKITRRRAETALREGTGSSGGAGGRSDRCVCGGYILGLLVPRNGFLEGFGGSEERGSGRRRRRRGR